MSAIDKLEEALLASDSSKLNQLLDKIIADLHFKSTTVDKDFVQTVISTCVKVPSEDTLLVAKCANLILILVQKRKVPLTESEVTAVVDWSTAAALRVADIALMDILQLWNGLITHLQPSFRGNCVDAVLNVVLMRLEDRALLSVPDDIKLWRLTCLRSLIPAILPDKLTLVMDAFLDVIYHQSAADLLTHAQMCARCVEGLSSGLEPWWKRQKRKNGDLLNRLLGSIFSIMELGRAGPPVPPRVAVPAPALIPPVSSSFYVDKPTYTFKLKKTRKPQMKLLTLENEENGKVNYFPSSDSDLSDIEGASEGQLVQTQARARYSAFNLISSMAKVIGCRGLFEFYGELLPRLTVAVQTETLAKPRNAAIAAIAALLIGAKPFLAQALYREGGAFTTFSESLAELVMSVNSNLASALRLATSPKHATALLTAISVLVCASPYHRLRPGIISDLFHAIHPQFSSSKYPDVSSAALSCLTEIVTLDPSPDEVATLIEENSLISFCLVTQKSNCVDVKTTAWDLINGIIFCHFSSVEDHRGDFKTACFSALNGDDFESKPKLAVFRSLETYLSKLVMDTDLHDEALTMWNVLLGPDSPLLRAIQTQSCVQSKGSPIACDCISSIGPFVFFNLPEEKRLLVVTLLLSCCSSESHAVRSSAVNALGTFLLFPHIINEQQLIYDTSDILCKSLTCSNETVRSKAAWAISNLVDLLRDPTGKEALSELCAFNLLKATNTVKKDSSKVKANILRASGHLLCLLTDYELKQDNVREVADDAVQMIFNSLSTGTLMKMRWNACQALATIFSNEHLRPVIHPYLEKIISSLCTSIVKCTNFKVRMKAASALSSIKRREEFSTLYFHTWTSVLDGLENAANMPDFAEFKHQNSLIFELSRVVCHLMSLLSEGDLAAFEDLYNLRRDPLKENLRHFQEYSPPDENGDLFGAIYRLKDLAKTSNRGAFVNDLIQDFFPNF